MPSSRTAAVPKLDTENGPAPALPFAGEPVVGNLQNTTLPGGLLELVGSGKLEAKWPFTELRVVGKSASTGGLAPLMYGPLPTRLPGPAVSFVIVVLVGLTTLK